MKKVLLFLGASLLFFSAKAAVLADGEGVKCSLEFDRNAQAPLRFAAEELASYFRRVTGRAFLKKGGYRICLRLQKDSTLGQEGYRLAGTKDKLLITGNTPRAVLYGTYAFIETYFGVRWLAPGRLYEYVPRHEKLVLPDRIDLRATPDFAVRLTGFVSSNWNSDCRETQLYLLRNRWQIKGDLRLRSRRYCRGFAEDYDRMDALYSAGGHCLSTLVPDKLFETHPEYFALVNGRRIRQTDEKKRQISQPCTTAEGVIDLAVRGIVRYFDQAPAGSSYLIGGNDVQVWCECENCRALDPPEERAGKKVSTRFFTFVNEVSRRVRLKHPRADIRAWGYQNYRFPPRNMTWEPRLRVALCDHHRCYRHSLTDHSCKPNKLFRRLFSSWRTTGVSVSERGYQETLLKEGFFYLPIEQVLASDLRFFKKIGVDGYEFITTPPDGTYGRRYTPQKKEHLANAMYCLWPALYVCGKMLWDTSLDPEKIWEDAGKHFYGSAWPAMKAYRKKLLACFAETEGHIIYNTPSLDAGRCLQKPGAAQELLALLEKAERLSAKDTDPRISRRLALEKRYFMETWLANAQRFEKTQPRTSAAARTSEKILPDGDHREKSWKRASYIKGFPLVPQEELFCQALFDDKYIFLAVTGPSPGHREKWLLSFPDHSREGLPPKVFDLDGKTPFEKGKKVFSGRVTFEIKLPRSLAGVSEEAGAFFVNVKKYRSSRICSRLFSGKSGGIALGKEAVKNGSFSQTEKTSSKRKNIISNTFPRFWGFSGKQAAFEKGLLAFDGVLYQFMSVSGGPAGGTLVLETVCGPRSGKPARLQPYLSLCTRKPADKRKFDHAYRKNASPAAVRKKGIYRFSFELAPYEKGYVYVRGRDIFLENLSLSFRPAPSSAGE